MEGGIILEFLGETIPWINFIMGDKALTPGHGRTCSLIPGDSVFEGYWDDHD